MLTTAICDAAAKELQGKPNIWVEFHLNGDVELDGRYTLEEMELVITKMRELRVLSRK